MTHDPLCPDFGEDQCGDERCRACYDCQCDLIAKVRVDERARATAADLTRLGQETA